MSAPVALALALALAPPQDAPSSERFGDPFGEIGGLAAPSCAEFLVEEGKVVGLAVLETGRNAVLLCDLAGENRRWFGEGELLEPAGMVLDDQALWVADTGHHRVVGFDLEGARTHTLGGFGDGPGEFHSPSGIASHGGRLAVVDTGNDRVQILEAGKLYAPVHILGGRGTDEGRFQRPVDCAFDAAGNLFVVDADNDRIQVFDAEGEFVRSFGEFGFHPGLLTDPSGIDVRGELVYVADRDNSRLQVFGLDGSVRYWWGVHALRPRESGGRLHYPEDVAIAPAGDLACVVERFEDRLQFFVREGENPPPEPLLPPIDLGGLAHYGGSVSAAGDMVVLVEPSRPGIKVYQPAGKDLIEVTLYERYGRGPGQLKRPVDTAFDLDRKRMFVADPAAGRISVFSVNREVGAAPAQDPEMVRFQLALDLEALRDEDTRWAIDPVALELGPAGELCVVDPRNRCLWMLSADLVDVTRLGGPECFERPVDAAFSPDGTRIFVADPWARDVVVMDRKGAVLARVGEHGGGPGFRPAGVAVDAKGALWVTDSIGQRLLRFDADLAPAGSRGGPGLGAVEFAKPAGLAFGPDGNLFLLDYGNHRIQEIDPQGRLVRIFGPRLFTRPALVDR